MADQDLGEAGRTVRKYFEEFCESQTVIDRGVIDRLVFAGSYGSWAYNTGVPGGGGDFDFIGVFSEDPKNLLSLPCAVKPAAQTLSNPPAVNGVKQSIGGGQLPNNIDYTFHSLTKWCTMISQGNPVGVELLFVRNLVFVQTPLWDAIREQRNGAAPKPTTTPVRSCDWSHADVSHANATVQIF